MQKYFKYICICIIFTFPGISLIKFPGARADVCPASLLNEFTVILTQGAVVKFE